MLRLTTKAGLATLAGVAGLLVSLFLLPAGPAAAGTAPPSGFEFVCANGGNGLCLTVTGMLPNRIANETKEPTTNAAIQLWKFVKEGVTSSTGPFQKGSGLNTQVAAGRLNGEWQDDGSGECLAFLNSNVTLNTCNQVGTEWVLSGSGRMISVLASNDGFENGGAPILEFLNSSGVNNTQPDVIAQGNSCPRSCWGPAAG
jgi:hypothetical protein